MDVFIACVAHKQYQRLVISGKPPENVIMEAWLDIKDQHMQVMKDPRNEMALSAMVDISHFELKKQAVNAMVSFLRSTYDEEIIGLLREEGYEYPFTEDSYLEDIDKVIAELGSEKVHFDILSQELRITDETEAENTPEDIEQSYYRTIRLLQKETGLCTGKSPVMAAKEITLYDFDCALVDYNRYVKSKKTTEDVTS